MNVFHTPSSENNSDQQSSFPASKLNPNRAGRLHGRASAALAICSAAGEKYAIHSQCKLSLLFAHEDRHLNRHARRLEGVAERGVSISTTGSRRPHAIAEGFGIPMFHDDYPFTSLSICGKCVNSCAAKVTDLLFDGYNPKLFVTSRAPPIGEGDGFEFGDHLATRG
jgi:hypothetical protein